MKILLLIFVFILSSYSISLCDYFIGSFQDYETNHLIYQINHDWTTDEILNGKYSTDIYGNLKTNVQRTTKAFSFICKNPDDKVDEYIWMKYSENESLISIDQNTFHSLIQQWYPDYLM